MHLSNQPQRGVGVSETRGRSRPQSRFRPSRPDRLHKSTSPVTGPPFKHCDAQARAEEVMRFNAGLFAATGDPERPGLARGTAASGALEEYQRFKDRRLDSKRPLRA